VELFTIKLKESLVNFGFYFHNSLKLIEISVMNIWFEMQFFFK